jgi:hypothetical protein
VAYGFGKMRQQFIFTQNFFLIFLAVPEIVLFGWPKKICAALESSTDQRKNIYKPWSPVKVCKSQYFFSSI